MKIDVKFTESTSEFPVAFGAVTEIKNGFTQEDVDKLVGDAAERSYEKGHAEGYNVGCAVGYEDGLTAGIQQGKQEEYDRFWDTYQANGTRTNYDYAYAGSGWNDETFKPKYIIRPVKADYLFNYAPISVIDKTTTDFSNTTSFYQCFGGESTTGVGCEEVHISIPKIKSLGGMFNRNMTLKKLILENVSEDCLFYVNTFAGCSGLKDVQITGTIGNGTVNLSWSKLTVDSMKNVISSLKNFTGTGKENTCTLKFSDDNWAALEESGTAPDGGTWKDYVSQVLCWNV